MDRAALNGTSPGLYLLAGCARQSTAISLLVVLLFTSACRGPVNNPNRVAEQFIEAVSTGSTAILDLIVAWDEVVINDYYVTGDYFNAQTPEKKQEIIRDYKKNFYTDYLPGARKVTYRVKTVYVARNISNAHIEFSFPGLLQSKAKKSGELEFTIKMRLDSEENRWYIVNLGDFLRLNFLQGDFDPNNFYLREPILP